MNTKSYLPHMIAGAAGAVVASALPFFLNTTQAQTKLLPFQGRLTDAAGAAIGDGAKVVEFKMYDAPTGGTVKWAGKVHKLSVNGGLVNTMLGSKASLGSVDFSTPTYLQITVDAQTDVTAGNGVINAADPPLLPRQSIVPAVYSAVAGQLQYVIPASTGIPESVNSKGWDAIFENGRPDIGKILPEKIADGSISAAKLAADSVTPNQLRANAVSSDKIVDGTIQPNDLSTSLQQSIIPTGSVIAYAPKDITTMQAPVG